MSSEEILTQAKFMNESSSASSSSFPHPSSPSSSSSSSISLPLSPRESLRSPRYLPEPKKRPSPIKNVKFNVVLEDAVKRMRALDGGISSIKKGKKGGGGSSSSSKKGLSFKASDVLTWLEKNNNSSRETALKLAEKLRVYLLSSSFLPLFSLLLVLIS